MTKVEELHDKIFGTHKTIISGTGAGSSFGHYPQMPTEEEFDAAIAAAEARGVERGRAEGAEQEAAKIVHCYECVGGDVGNTPEKDLCVGWSEGKSSYCSGGKRVSPPIGAK